MIIISNQFNNNVNPYSYQNMMSPQQQTMTPSYQTNYMNRNLFSTPQQQTSAQHYDILEVNGYNAMNMLNMLPNSRTIALDIKEPILWFAQTDGAGYKTIKAFNISPIDNSNSNNNNVNLNEIEENMKNTIISLEERISKLEGALNDGKHTKPDDKRKSTTSSTK